DLSTSADAFWTSLYLLVSAVDETAHLHMPHVVTWAPWAAGEPAHLRNALAASGFLGLLLSMNPSIGASIPFSVSYCVPRVGNEKKPTSEAFWPACSTAKVPRKYMAA